MKALQTLNETNRMLLWSSELNPAKKSRRERVWRDATTRTLLLLAAWMLWSVAQIARGSTTNYLNFDTVDASQGYVDATTYLAGAGITLTNVTPPASLVIADDRVFASGACVAASSPHSFIFQDSGGSSPCSYTLLFSSPAESVTFTRCSRTDGCPTPKWTASAYAGDILVYSTGVCCTNSDLGLPVTTYTLNGPGITSLTITSEGENGVALDDFQIVYGCPSVGFGAPSWPDATAGDTYVQPLLADSRTDVSWGNAQPIPAARYGSASGIINGYLYVASGFDGGTTVSNVDACDPAGSTWVSKAPIPVAMFGGAAGVINSRLYVAGGTTPDNADVVNTLRMYDPDTDTWTIKAPMPNALDRAAADVLGGKLYVVGGHMHSDCPGVTNVVSYDPDSDTWTPIAALPTARGKLAVAVADGVLYAIGGESDDCGGSQLNIVEAYEPLSQMWQTLAPMPTPRSLPTVGSVNNTLFVVGGQGHSGALSINESCRQKYDFSVATGAMPQGLTLSSNGVVSGVPMESGDFSFTIGATNAFGCAEAQVVTLAVRCRIISLSPITLPDAHPAIPFTQTFTATGGTPPYRYTLTQNQLPDNFKINTNTGVLTGIPLSLDTYTFTIRATDAVGCFNTRDYTLVTSATGNSADTTSPAVAIKSPTNRSVFTDPAITITGTALDATGKVRTGVAGVVYWLNGNLGLADTANAFTNWSVAATLQPGWNIFTAQAFDHRGNASALASNIFFYGTRTDIVGMYDGLFYQTNTHGAPLRQAQFTGSLLSMALILNGKYAGKLVYQGKSYTVRGAFDLAGNSTTTVSRASTGEPDLTLNMNLDWTGITKQIRGTVSCTDEGWTSALMEVWTSPLPPHIDP